MIKPEITQMIVHAVGHMRQMSGSKHEIEQSKIKLQQMALQLQHRRDMAGMQMAIMKDLIHSMIDRRVDAISAGFTLTIGMYADQANHYMAEQAKVTDARIMCLDPLQRAGLAGRTTEIDMQLRRIRADALRLYQEMNRALLAVGGNMPRLPGGMQSSLMLPS